MRLEPARAESPLPPLAVVADEGQAAALLQPDRRRLLSALASPDSASGLARRFELPRQRLNYHLRELERVGLVTLVGERKKGNCLERVVQATARAYVISPEAIGVLGSPAPGAADRLGALHLVSLAARVIREVGGSLTRAMAAGKRLATFSIDAEVHVRSADERARFARDLTTAVTAVVRRYHDPSARSGRTMRVTAAVYVKPVDATRPAASEGS